MKLMTLGLAGLLATGTLQTLRADDHRGAGLGAILGGVAGGIIGHQSDETGAGVAIGAVTGAVVGHVIDSSRNRTTVEYRSSPPARWDDCSPRRPVVVYRDPPCPPARRVVVYSPRPATPPPVVVVVKSEPATPPPAVIVTSTTSAYQKDDYGYVSADYLALMKPAELVLLRQRAYGTDAGDLAIFLTEREKGNLRARAASQVVIGEQT